jgi:hypothetical protein
MKFILGLLVGIGGAWLYRAWGPQNLPFSETISNVGSATTQKATEIIDQTPIPPQAEDVASSAPSPAEQAKDVASPVAATGPKARTRTRAAAPKLDQTA